MAGSALVPETDRGESPDIVSQQLRNRLRVLGHLDRARDTLQGFTDAKARTRMPRPALIELHATDSCELDCVFCTYNDRTHEAFPWDKLDRVEALDPRAIVIVGGGEPTLYRWGEKRIGDLLLELSARLPRASLGLASNGAVFPGDEAARALKWVRVSLDAATAATHDATKRDRRNSLESRVANVMSYLRAGVESVGVGFVYHKYNLDEAAAFVSTAFQWAQEAGPDGPKRLNLQFRPTCGIQSCECPSPNYSEASGRLMTPDLTEDWQRRREQQRRQLLSRMAESPPFERFVRESTNFFGAEMHEPIPRVGRFDRCYLSLVRMLIRANGDVFPCVMKASQRHSPVGNLLRDEPENLWRGLAEYYRLDTGRCRGQADCCNIDGVKNVYLEGALVSGAAGHDPGADPFF